MIKLLIAFVLRIRRGDIMLPPGTVSLSDD